MSVDNTKYPIWYIQTFGGGTPAYLIAAPDRETAWYLVQEKWREKYTGPVGSSAYSYGGGNTADDIKETGMYADIKNLSTNIINLHELKKQKIK